MLVIKWKRKTYRTGDKNLNSICGLSNDSEQCQCWNKSVGSEDEVVDGIKFFSTLSHHHSRSLMTG